MNDLKTKIAAKSPRKCQRRTPQSAARISAMRSAAAILLLAPGLLSGSALAGAAQNAVSAVNHELPVVNAEAARADDAALSAAAAAAAASSASTTAPTLEDFEARSALLAGERNARPPSAAAASDLPPAMPDVFLLMSLAVPDEALRTIAKDAASLGIPLVFRGLPMEKAPPDSESAKPAVPAARVARGEIAARIAPLTALGCAVSVDPARWRYVEAALGSPIAVPALVVSLVSLDRGSANPAARADTPAQLEIVPGEFRPRYALQWCEQNARSREMRSAVARFLEARGASDAAVTRRP